MINNCTAAAGGYRGHVAVACVVSSYRYVLGRNIHGLSREIDMERMDGPSRWLCASLLSSFSSLSSSSSFVVVVVVSTGNLQAEIGRAHV